MADAFVVALKRTEHDRLIVAALADLAGDLGAVVHVADLTADERFINLNFTVNFSKLRVCIARRMR